MGTARRLYLYVATAVSLAVAASGVATLLRAILAEIEDRLGGSLISGETIAREQLSLAIALLAVGLPVWALHWWLIRRGTRVGAQRASEEVASPIRALFFALVAAATVAIAIGTLSTLMAGIGERLLGLRNTDSWSWPLAGALVAVPLWVMHVRLRESELRGVRLDGAGMWLTRLYRYGAAFGTLVIALFAMSTAIATILSVAVGRPDFAIGDEWWRSQLVDSLALAGIGLGAWWVHWRLAGNAIRDAGQLGEDERDTRLRATYLAGVVLVGAANAGIVVAGSVAELGRMALGVTASVEPMALLEEVVGPPIAVLPFALAAWWHLRRLQNDARVREHQAPGSHRPEAARRLVLHLGAILGLAFLAVGSARLLGLAIEAIGLSGELTVGGTDPALRQLPWHAAQVLVGGACWLPCWAAILADRGARPAMERAATSARAYLFLVVGAALIAAVPSGTFVLFRLLDTALGGTSTSPLAVELAFALSVLIVAVIIGLGHGRMLIADMRAEPTLAPAAAPGVPVTAPPVEAILVLRMPAGIDETATVAAMRRSLPGGATLERWGGTDSPAVADVPRQEDAGMGEVPVGV
jgi:hypothetical protein